MALVLGTNCGFVTVAPTDDPAVGNKVIDAVSWGLKHTTPVDVTKITQIGWWCDTATEEANFEVGLYAHDAVNNCPAARLYVDATNAKGITSGWKTVVVDWDVTAETVYWIAVQLDNTATTTNTNYGGQAQGSLGPSATELPNPWGNTNSRVEIYAFYALYSTASFVDITGTIAGTSSLSGALTYDTQILLTGTITGTSTVGGVLGATLILSSNWQTDNFKTIKRLVVIGNDGLWYEAI